MAFTPETLSIIVQPIGGEGMRFFCYETADDVGTVAGTDYFTDAKRFGIEVSDLIFVAPESGDPYIMAVEAVDDEGNVTATVTATEAGLPREALTFIRRNAANTAFEALSPDDVLNALSISLELTDKDPGTTGLAVLEAETADDARGEIGSYDSKSDVTGRTIPAALASIVLLGLATAGDGGGGLYERVGSEPSHEAKIQDASGAWFELRPDKGVVTPLQVDASADGDGAGAGTDDTTALNNTIEAAEAIGAHTIDGLLKWYRLDGKTTLKSDIKLCNFKTDHANTTATEFFEVAGTEDAAIDVSGNIQKQNTSFSVADTSTLSRFDWVKVTDENFWSTTTTAGNIKSGELIRIKSVDNGTGLTSFAHAHQDYQSGANATIRKQNYVENITVEDFTVRGPGTATNITAFNIIRGYKVHFYRIDVRDVGARGVDFEASLRCSVNDSEFHADGGSSMYGVSAIQGCERITVDNCDFYRCRHMTAAGGSDGVNRHMTVNNCRGIGMTDAGMDAHPASDLFQWTDNFVEVEGSESNPDGLLYQGSRLTATGNKIKGALARGIFCQGKVANVPDGDDNWHVIDKNVVDAVSITTGIEVSTEEDRPIDGGSITGNTVRGTITNNGIKLFASAAAIAGVDIIGGTIDRVQSAGIYLDANGHSIQSIRISAVSVFGDSGESDIDLILLLGDASNRIRYVTIGGCVLRDGEYAVRGNNCSDVNVDGNTIEDISGSPKINLSGSNNKIGTQNVGYVNEAFGEASDTTNGSGDITISHGLDGTPSAFFAAYSGTGSFVANARNATSSSLVVRVRNLDDGSPLDSQSVTVTWRARI